jgi:hypothetical protein
MSEGAVLSDFAVHVERTHSMLSEPPMSSFAVDVERTCSGVEFVGVPGSPLPCPVQAWTVASTMRRFVCRFQTVSKDPASTIWVFPSLPPKSRQIFSNVLSRNALCTH